MNTTFSKLLIFSLLILSTASCKKDTEMPTGVFVNLETHKAGTITAISAEVEAETKTNCTERGVCWGKNPNPTIDDFHVADGKGKGKYTCTLTDLEPNQKYYYRAYASTGKKYVYAQDQDEKSFTTRDGVVKLTTGYVRNITPTSANITGGKVTSDGGCPITERGICYGQNANPTLENAEHVAVGSGIGDISATLTKLTPNVTYYVRSYATRCIGTTYAQDEINFVTTEGLPTVTNGSISNITATSVECSGYVSYDGGFPVTERGICWSTTSNPTLENAYHVTAGSGTGNFSATLTDLAPNTKYYVCAYATNRQGTTYDQDKNFTTKDGIAKLETNNPSNIKSTSANCGGKVTNNGGFEIIEKGICWSTNANPTLDNAQHSTANSGTSSFSMTISGLTPSTTYHVRAYAINNQDITYYDEGEKSFTTTDGLPTVTTNYVSDIAMTSARCSGKVTNGGDFTVNERGICWSTSPHPTLENANHETAGSGTGSFTVSLTGLEENTTYYICSYAINTLGTRYGDEVAFSTLAQPITITANGVAFDMLLVEGGTFWMGAQSTNPNGQNYYSYVNSDESPVHQVTLSSFYMGETEVTQALWEAVMGSNPSYFSGSNLPVEKVCWNDCQEFITKLNQLCASQLNGKQFRLPTEAEWEYAARGGRNNQGYEYSGSNTLGDVAWYYDNSSKTHAVGTKQANDLGLYDMSGNVWEWCSDWYGSYSDNAQTDPTGPAYGSERVIRGGSWSSSTRGCRVSNRSDHTPGESDSYLGLRLALR